MVERNMCKSHPTPPSRDGMRREPPGQSGVAASTAMPVIGREMVQVLKVQPRRDGRSLAIYVNNAA
jgi:hypothetical protein